jgi:hypothetical protein
LVTALTEALLFGRMLPGVEDAKLRQYLSWLRLEEQGGKQPAQKPKQPKQAKRTAAAAALEVQSCRRSLRSNKNQQQQEKKNMGSRDGKANHSRAVRNGKGVASSDAKRGLPAKRRRLGDVRAAAASGCVS